MPRLWPLLLLLGCRPVQSTGPDPKYALVRYLGSIHQLPKGNTVLLRALGHKAQELETGPYVFLLSDSIPVAYRQDESFFRTDAKVRKGQTRHINAWLKGRPAQVIPDAQLRSTFESLSRFSPEPPDRRQQPRRAQDTGRSVPESEYLAFQLWQAQRRIADLESQLAP